METKTKASNDYGMWVFYCPCGWISRTRPGRRASSVPPAECEACHVKPGELVTYNPMTGCGSSAKEAEWTADVATTICTIADEWSKRVWQHAETNGYYLYRTSPKRFVILRKDYAKTLKIGDGPSRWPYVEMKAAYGPGSFQDVMTWLKTRVPELPEYLRRGG